jgi:DNA replication and repair protein RecF
LAAVAAGAEQVLMTAAVPEDVPAELDATRIGVDSVLVGAERVSRLAERSEELAPERSEELAPERSETPVTDPSEDLRPDSKREEAQR